MNVKSLKFLVMIIFFSIALISCSQNVSLDNIQETSTATAEDFSVTLTYSCMELDNLRYEIPADWKTYSNHDKIYYCSPTDDYLMVSYLTTEFSKESDKNLTDNCSDTLLNNLNGYNNFLLQTDCSGDIDGIYCRKIVYSYTNENQQNVVERTVIFSINGKVYSFDCVSLNDQPKDYEEFRRIIGSIIVSSND